MLYSISIAFEIEVLNYWGVSVFFGHSIYVLIIMQSENSEHGNKQIKRYINMEIIFFMCAYYLLVK